MSIEVDEGTIRQAIHAITQLLKNPQNGAARSLARISAETLSGYLPEVLASAKEELRAHDTYVGG